MSLSTLIERVAPRAHLIWLGEGIAEETLGALRAAAPKAPSVLQMTPSEHEMRAAGARRDGSKEWPGVAELRACESITAPTATVGD